MKPVVLDCSVAMAWCFEDQITEYSDEVLHYVSMHGALVSPLWLSEVTNVLSLSVKKRRMDLDGSLLFLENISRLPIRIATLSSKEYFTGVFQLALEEGLTSYDAIYLFLAKREKLSLATLDRDLRNSAGRHKLSKLGY